MLQSSKKAPGELLTSSEDLSAPRETQVMRQSQGEGKLGRAPRASQLHYQGYGLQSSNTSITWKLLVVLAPPLPPPPPQPLLGGATYRLRLQGSPARLGVRASQLGHVLTFL